MGIHLGIGYMTQEAGRKPSDQTRHESRTDKPDFKGNHCTT